MGMISEERIRKLEKVLVNYSNILSEFEIKEQVLKAFKFQKPLTSIEVESEDNEKLVRFMKELEDFFFVGHVNFEYDSQEFGFSGLVLLSRFKNLFDVAFKYAKEHNGLLDEFADLSGIFAGKSPKEVAKYCSKERLKKYNLIK